MSNDKSESLEKFDTVVMSIVLISSIMLMGTCSYSNTVVKEKTSKAAIEAGLEQNDKGNWIYPRDSQGRAGTFVYKTDLPEEEVSDEAALSD